MPKRRMITAAIWDNPKFAAMKYRQQLLAIGLITNADDQGRLRGDPNLIRSLVFPFSNMSSNTVTKDIEAIAANGTILRYESEGQSFIQILNWWRYQRPNWAAPSDHPPPPNWKDRINYRLGGETLSYNWGNREDTCNAQGDPIQAPFDVPLDEEPMPNSMPIEQPIEYPIEGESKAHSLSKEKLSVSVSEEKISGSGSQEDPRPPPPEHNPILQFEQSFGQTISPHLRDDILDLQRECEELGHPEWVCEAILEAEHHGVRKWSYAKACVKNWIKNGGRAPPPKGPDTAPMTKAQRRERYLGGKYGHLVEH